MAFKMKGSSFKKTGDGKDKIRNFIKNNVGTMSDEEIMSNPVIKNYSGEVNWNKNGDVEFY